MNKRNHVELDTRDKDVKVKITWTEKRRDMYLRGYPINAQTGVPIDSVKPVIRKARTKDEIEYVKIQIRDAIVEKMKKSARKAAVKSDEYVEGLDVNEIMVRAFEEVVHSDALTFFWADGTIREYSSKCRREILVKVQHCKSEDDFSKAQYDEMVESLIQSILDKQGTAKNLLNATRSANVYITAFKRIYALMRERYPDLPDLQFFRELKTMRRQVEQIKSIPNFVIKRCRDYVELELDINPALARSAACMLSGELRTAEAAAIIAFDSVVLDTFVIINVEYQERNHKRINNLKTPAAHRKVVLDEWGAYVVLLANWLLKDDINSEEAPLTSKELSDWIKEMLQKCGIDDKYMDAYKKTMLENPDYDDKGMPSGDLQAYILRRKANEIRTNICGFTKAELDYQIGHAHHSQNGEKFNSRKVENLRALAEKLRRYDLNPELSRSPKHSPIEIQHGAELTFAPFDKYRLKNISSEPVKVCITVTPAEPGESIEISNPREFEAWTVASDSIEGCRRNVEVIGVLHEEDKGGWNE